MADKYPPSIKVAKLYERTSAKGNSYITGRWGGARVTILKTDQTDDKGNPVWELRLSEAPPYVAPEQRESSQPPDFVR